MTSIHARAVGAMKWNSVTKAEMYAAQRAPFIAGIHSMLFAMGATFDCEEK
jgi:hypothetical protein